MQTETIKVTGMTCSGCVDIVTRALVAIDGVNNVNVSLANGEAKVDFDASMTSTDKLDLAVEKAGYGVSEINSDAPKAEGKTGCCC
jgi:copper chaperone